MCFSSFSLKKIGLRVPRPIDQAVLCKQEMKMKALQTAKIEYCKKIIVNCLILFFSCLALFSIMTVLSALTLIGGTKKRDLRKVKTVLF